MLSTRNVALIPALIVPLLLVACGGGNSGEPAPTQTPTVNATSAAISTQKASIPPTSLPTSTPLVAGPGVRHCQAADIATRVGTGAAFSQHQAVRIIMVDKSDTPCQMTRPPDVQFVDAQGDPSPITASGPCGACDYFRQPVLLLPGLGTDGINLRAGQAALWLMWPEYLREAPCTPSPPAASRIQLSLPDTSDEIVIDLSAELEIHQIVTCNGLVQIQGYGPGNAP